MTENDKKVSLKKVAKKVYETEVDKEDIVQGFAVICGVIAIIFFLAHIF